MAEIKRPVNWSPSAEQAGGGLLEGATTTMEKAGKAMLRAAPHIERFILNRVANAPATMFTIANVVAERNLSRSAAKAVGGKVGGGIGAALGVEGGPPGVFAGAAAGSVVGEKAGELIYDHGDDIKTWMREREHDLARKAGEVVRAWTPAPYRQFL